MRKLILFLTLSLILTACTMQQVVQVNTGTPQSTTTSSDNTKTRTLPPELPADQLKDRVATIKTDKGDIVIKLRGDVAPLTVSNFIALAKDGFYNGLTFHRREEGFVIQGGDPKGDGTGGPGYTIPAELSGLEHNRGVIAMARLGDSVNPKKESSGSQFYITLAPAHFLDGEYTTFGEVTSGMDVADKIQVGDKILSVEIK